MNRCEPLEPRRLLAVLSTDVTWGTGGYITRHSEVNYLGQGGGGIYTLTSGTPQIEQRFTDDGKIDAAFSSITATDPFENFAVDGQGRSLLYHLSTSVATVLRYTPAGVLDTTFGTGGKLVIASPNSAYDSVAPEQLIASADGSLYLSATLAVHQPASDMTSSVDYAFLHITASGMLDTAFGSGGLALLPAAGHFDDNRPQVAMTTDTTGRLIVKSYLSGATTFYRYTTAGRLDTGFANGGKLVDNRAVISPYPAFAVDAQNRLLLLDYPSTSGTPTPLRRFTAAGQIDTTFAANGVALLPGDSTNAVTGVFVQSDGKIDVNLMTNLVRLNADGTPDTFFGPAGVSDAPSTSNFAVVGLLPDNSLLATENVSRSNQVAIENTLTKLAVVPPASLGFDGELDITGTSGDDHIVLTADSDDRVHVAFGDGEAFDFVAKTVVADLGAGDDVFIDNYHPDKDVLRCRITGGAGNDSIVTGGADDLIDSGAGDDTVIANGGNDFILVREGNNTVDAGTGGGTIFSSSARDEHNTVVGYDGAWDIDMSGRNNIALSGTSAKVVLYGDGGPNHLQLDLTGSAKIDTGTEDDTIITDDVGQDIISDAGGNNAITTYGQGNNLIHVAAGNNTIVGGSGNDTVRTGAGNDSISGGLGKDDLRGNAGNDTIDGGGGRDKIFGQAGDDSLLGGGNDDLIVGGLGNDTLIGNKGNDLLIAGDPNAPRVQSALNHIDGGAGIDRVQLEADDDEVMSVETLLLTVA